MTEKETFLRFMLDCSTDIFMEADRCGCISYACAKAGLVFHRQTVEGRNLCELFDEKNTFLLTREINNTLYQNYPDTFMLEYRSRFYNVYIYPYHGKAILCFKDITEQRQLSHHLHQTRQRMEFAERTAKLGYWELDVAARKFYWSAEMFRIFDADAGQTSPKQNLIREKVIAEDLPLYKKQLARLIKQGHPVEGQLRLRRRNGTVTYCLFKAALLNENSREIIAGTFQDITSWIEIRHILEKARRHAEELCRSQAAFLARASHDLRQPMQALNMFISAMDNKELTPEQQNIFAKIQASAAGLKSLLDNLLDISKLDSGGMDYQPQPFNLAELLRRLGAEYQEIAAEKNLSLRLKLHDCMVNSDALLIERVVRNLLGNALKFARTQIILSSRCSANEVSISVTDNGIGISPEEQRYIFDEFYQSRTNPSCHKDGAGLGLNIVKKVTALLDGRIKVRSVPDKYTAFRFTFHR